MHRRRHGVVTLQYSYHLHLGLLVVVFVVQLCKVQRGGALGANECQCGVGQCHLVHCVSVCTVGIFGQVLIAVLGQQSVHQVGVGVDDVVVGRIYVGLHLGAIISAHHLVVVVHRAESRVECSAQVGLLCQRAGAAPCCHRCQVGIRQL